MGGVVVMVIYKREESGWCGSHGCSGSGQLQANPHVAGPWLSPGKPTRRAVTTMGSNDLVVGEDHKLGPSCQRYNWQTVRCDSMAFDSSPRRWKTLISNPRCLAEVSTYGKDFRR